MVSYYHCSSVSYYASFYINQSYIPPFHLMLTIHCYFSYYFCLIIPSSVPCNTIIITNAYFASVCYLVILCLVIFLSWNNNSPAWRSPASPWTALPTSALFSLNPHKLLLSSPVLFIPLLPRSPRANLRDNR